VQDNLFTCKMPIGILQVKRYKVNTKIEICNGSKNFDIDINDLLDNIRILTRYILSKRKRRVNLLPENNYATRVTERNVICVQQETQYFSTDQGGEY